MLIILLAQADCNPTYVKNLVQNGIWTDGQVFTGEKVYNFTHNLSQESDLTSINSAKFIGASWTSSKCQVELQAQSN
jgi:hypothetical protein